MRFELKKCKGVTFHGTEQWCMIWINPDVVVSKRTWRIGWSFIRPPKSLKTCTMMTSFCPKYVFQLEHFRGLCVMTLKGVAKFKEKLICGLKNVIRNFVNSHASSQKSENLHFDWILLSEAYKDLDEKVQKSYVSCHWIVWKKTDTWFQKWHEEFGEF